ncbi:MAG: DUF5652 family protein [Patescibacteria group bacterium]
MRYFFSSPMMSQSFGYTTMMWWLTPLLIWSLIWKGLALWKAAKNNQLYWFLPLLILNTAGLLEIAYLAFFQVNPDPAKPWQSGTKRAPTKRH